MYCKNCGMKLDEEAIFCKECGAEVKRKNFVVKAKKKNSLLEELNQNKLLLIITFTILICSILGSFCSVYLYNRYQNRQASNLVGYITALMQAMSWGVITYVGMRRSFKFMLTFFISKLIIGNVLQYVLYDVTETPMFMEDIKLSYLLGNLLDVILPFLIFAVLHGISRKMSIIRFKVIQNIVPPIITVIVVEIWYWIYWCIICIEEEQSFEFSTSHMVNLTLGIVSMYIILKCIYKKEDVLSV